MQVSVILHDIRSSENVGSIFRSADGAGAAKIYLTGYTPAPIDRFGRANAKLAKTALGAEKSVPWEKRDIHELLTELKSKKVEIVAVEQDPRSASYMMHHPSGDAALIFGNEVHGVPKVVIDLCGAVIDIPMRGKKESLNVAVAAGVVLYQFLR